MSIKRRRPVLGTLRLDTLRPNYSASSGATTAPTLYLQRIVSTGKPMGPRHYYGLPSSAMSATYMFHVDPDEDIQVGDIITNVTLKDNITPWPNDMPLTSFTWHVVYTKITAAVIMSYRSVYVSRVITSGTAHL
jgi:hypothetical protein